MMRKAAVFSLILATTACSTETETVTVPGEGCADATTDTTIATEDSSTVGDSAPADSSATTDSAVATDSGAASDTTVVATDSASDTIVPADTGPGCDIKTGGDFCTKIPKLTFSGTQTVDGIGDEFCDIPSTTTTIKTGIPYPSTPASLLPGKVKSRVAWSAAGVHAHFHIDDPEVISIPIDYGGDALWLFIGGNSPLYGEFPARGAKDKGFFIVQMEAPSPRPPGLTGFTENNKADAKLFFFGHQYATDTPSTYCAGLAMPLYSEIPFAGRLVPGGYELELFIPWRILGRATAPTTGDDMSIDLMFVEQDDLATAAPPFVGTDPVKTATVFHHIGGTPSGASCCTISGGTTITPICDSRTWCMPTLE